MDEINGQIRTVVKNVYPNIEEGKYAIKRVVGESIDVWADVFADGHDIVTGALQFKHHSEKDWSETRATSIGEDRWHASFQVAKLGEYLYRFIGWADYALYWQDGIIKKINAGLDISLELLEGVQFLNHLTTMVQDDDIEFVNQCLSEFNTPSKSDKAIQLAKSKHLKNLFEQFPYRPFIAISQNEYSVCVEREKAVFSTWYEFFPRSSSAKKGTHGTFKNCINLLPRLAEFGFDTIYFPPVHPIGTTNRKGKNGSTTAGPEDVGSCWGIGSDEGGHASIHSELGSLSDFEDLLNKANSLGLEIAMDFALQASPDHPWAKKYPEWFKLRPDGSIQYAENPPKKYQDIYPFFFESDDWEKMWEAFLEILLFWIKKGVKIFRVDNPHTKPFIFWEWIISRVRVKHPEVLFLSEAFSRPAIMQELAKLGFSQSYTYYTWRNTKQEIIDYMMELTRGPTSEYFRPNFWPNTPDILPYPLQNPSEALYVTRYFLAATLSSNCGVYGPIYELMVNQSISGKEEYLNSEKFQYETWDWKKRNKITEVYTIVNHARKNIKALQRTNNIDFLHVENEYILAYIKTGTDGSKVICVVNLDPVNKQTGNLHVHPDQLGLSYDQEIQLIDKKDNRSYHWKGEAHYIELHPESPYHLFVTA